MSDRVTAPATEAKAPAVAARAAALPSLTPVRSALLQRTCGCGQAPGAGDKCNECDKEKQKQVLQRKSSGGPQPASIPPVVNQALSSPGQPLDGSTRTFMESRFGHDFSRVRVHHDGTAAESAKAVHARAFTVGQHIVFNRAEYQPHTTEGQKLLAHELAHTIQQGDRAQLQSKMEIDPAGSQTEREADQVANRVIAGGPAAVYQQASTGAFQRQEQPETDCRDALFDPTDERVNGTRAHTIITDDYKSKIGDKKKTRGLAIPGASADPLRVGDDTGKSDSVIPPEGIPGYEKTREGEGRPDLVYRGPKEIEVAEIKVATPGHFVTAEQQLQRYISQANENPEWLSEKRLTTFAAMPKSRFAPTSPLDVDGKQVKVTWCTSGILVYKPIDLSKVAGAEASDTDPYEIKYASLQAILRVPKGAVKKADTVDISPDDPAARMLPRLTFVRLHRKPAGDDVLDAVIRTTSNSKDPKGLPIEISGTKEIIQFTVNKKTRRLTEKQKKTEIPFNYKPLSMGTITEVSLSEEDGLSGKGNIKPSIPLLKGLNLEIAFSKDSLIVTSRIPKDKLKSLPGFTVTDASLDLVLAPEFKPSGSITFYIGPKNKPFADGKIEVSADGEGFYAKGDINTHIPGVDEAPIKVIYRRASGWSGVASITTSKIPFVQNANLTVSFSDEGMDLSGGLKIGLANDQSVSLGVQKKKGTNTWIYTGEGQFKLKPLDPVVISFTYDGEKVSGKATTGFTFKGLEGNITVTYTNGVVTGTGKLKIAKPEKNPKLTGSIDVTLNKNHRFSGEGTISYEIKPGLVATAGIKIDEHEKVTVMGSLVFPPYQLFKKFPDPPKRITIFEIPTISIPIPGASIGPIGLKAKIDAGIYAEYGIGPGEIRGGYVKSTINPLEENVDLDVEVGGQVFIPAFFRVTGAVSGSVALDIGIASVAGGLTVSVTASLDGHVLSNLKAHYFKGKFEAQADFELILALALYLALKAFVKAEAGVWRFKVTTTKEWELASFKFDTGLKMGVKLKKPISYSSETGFAAPSLDDIEWIMPKFEPEKAVKAGFDRDPGTEKEQ
ncbi:MAG: hypothetical protein JWM21_676 [Acidobacteria bacterium]|nr:hypothetical protein [Acidobacteriota bacterium]